MFEVDRPNDSESTTELSERSSWLYTKNRLSINTSLLSISISRHAETAPAWWRRQRVSFLTSTSPMALARIAAQSSPAELLAFDRLFRP